MHRDIIPTPLTNVGDATSFNASVAWAYNGIQDGRPEAGFHFNDRTKASGNVVGRRCVPMALFRASRGTPQEHRHPMSHHRSMRPMVRPWPVVWPPVSREACPSRSACSSGFTAVSSWPLEPGVRHVTQYTLKNFVRRY